jgi:hypothetical protein
VLPLQSRLASGSSGCSTTGRLAYENGNDTSGPSGMLDPRRARCDLVHTFELP